MSLQGDGARAAGRAREDGEVVDRWRALLRRRWRTGAAIFVAVVGLGALLLLTAHPVHRAEATMRLADPPPPGGVSAGSGLASLFGLGGDAFSNDLELLGSRTVAEGVVRDAALNVRLSAPKEWYRDSLFVLLEADTTTVAASFDVEWLEDGGVAVRMTAPEDTAAWRTTPGEILEFAGIRAVFRPWREEMPRSVSLASDPFGEAVRSFRSALEVERTRREANVVEVAFEHGDPEVTGAVVAGVLRHFVALRTEIQRRESGETVDSLRTVADETLVDLQAAEGELEDLQRRTRIVSPDVQSEVLVERYGTVLAELETARAGLAGIDSILRRVEAVENPADAWTQLAAYPRFLENETVGQLLGRLTELEEHRTALAARRTTENRQYRTIMEQLDFLDASLRSLARNYRHALEERIGELEERVGEMDRSLAGVPSQVIELGRRQRDVRILSEVMVLTEQRLRQEELRQALTFANVQVIDPPALLPRPVWPRKKLGLLVGIVLGGGFALLGMVVAERADRSVRSAREIRRIAGAPVLATPVRAGAGYAFHRAEARAVLREVLTSNSRVVLAPVDGHADVDALAEALRGEAGLGSDVASTARVRSAPATTPVAAGTPEPGSAHGSAAGGEENGDPSGSSGSGPPRRPDEVVVAALPLDRVGAAAEAAGRGGVVLVVSYGRTGARELARGASLLGEVGAEPVGVVVVCDGDGEVRAVWA